MAQPEVIKDIDARVKIPGDTMTGNLTAPTFIGTLNGNASSADKLNTNAGSLRQPIYFNDGKPIIAADNYVFYDEVSGTVPSSGPNSFVLKIGDTMTGNLIINKTGTAAIFGGNVNYINGAVYNPTAGIQICAGTGGATNSTAIGFHNPGISSASLGYYNTDIHTGQFKFLSDDSNWSLLVGGNLLIQKPTPEILLYNTISDSWSVIRIGELNKPHTVMFHNASSRADDGGANLFTIRNDTGGGIRLDSDTRITGYLTIGQQDLNTEATLYVNGTGKFKNKVYIGNTIGINELTIYGALSTTNAGFQDGHDRPGLKILGHYPQIVLMGGGVSNVNHGATVSLGAYDDPQASTVNFKTWTFGTPGYNATWMDLVYNVNGSNPHNGINNWSQGGGATHHRLMRFEGASPKIIGYGKMLITPPDSGGSAPGDQALKVIQAHTGGGVNASAAVFSHVYGSHDYGVVMNLNIQSSTGDLPSLRFSVGNYETETRTNGTTSWSLGYCQGGGADYHFRIKRNHGWNSWGDEALRIDSNSLSVYVSSLYGAVWNDYAEYRSSDPIESGRVICETGNGTLKLSTERLQPGANVVSDTFGFAIGETENCKTPIAVSGRALVYTYEDRYSYKAGDPVCAAPDGTVSKMSREEVMMYPDRIVGTVSEIPEYERWGTGNVEIKNRIWIKVK